MADTLINKIEHSNTNEDISNKNIESEIIELNKKSRNSIFKNKLKLKNPPTYIYKKKNK